MLIAVYFKFLLRKISMHCIVYLDWDRLNMECILDPIEILGR